MPKIEFNERIDWRRFGELRESSGSKQYANTVLRLIKEGAINRNNFSIRGLWESMGSPNLTRDMNLRNPVLDAEGMVLQESMDSTLFPVITGSLISKFVQEGYMNSESIGDELVTTIPSSQRDDTVVGYTSADTVEEVIEGMDYKEGYFGEKYHKIRNRKFGKILSITMEMIKFDQTGQVVMRANNIGESARAKREEIIMRAVCGSTTTGAYASWRPAGTATTLYSDTSTDPYTSATLDNVLTSKLADETDIDDALALFQTYTDESGNYISIDPKIMLVAPGYFGIATKITTGGQYSVLTAPPGVAKARQYNLQVRKSQWIYGLLGAAYWIIGDPKKQFVYTEVFPLETLQERPGSESDFNRDVVVRVKARMMGGCGAISNRFCVRSTGAT